MMENLKVPARVDAKRRDLRQRDFTYALHSRGCKKISTSYETNQEKLVTAKRANLGPPAEAGNVGEPVSFGHAPVSMLAARARHEHGRQVNAHLAAD